MPLIGSFSTSLIKVHNYLFSQEEINFNNYLKRQVN